MRIPGSLFHLLLALIFGGCSLVNAEKAVTACYTAVGAAAVVSRPSLQQCQAHALADKSESEMQACHAGAVIMEKAQPAAEDVCHAGAEGIAVAAAAGVHDYSGALAPLYRGMADLAQALVAAGVKLPAGISLPGVN